MSILIIVALSLLVLAFVVAFLTYLDSPTFLDIDRGTAERVYQRKITNYKFAFEMFLISMIAFLAEYIVTL